MVTKTLEILEPNVELHMTLDGVDYYKDRIRITITDTSGENTFVSEKLRVSFLKTHEEYAEFLRNAMITHKGFE